MRWLLQCNPTKWRIHDFVADGHEITAWTATRHLSDIRPDQDIALWLTGSTGGVVAVGHTTGPPTPVAEGRVDDGYYAEPPDPVAARWVVPVRLTRRFLDQPVPRTALAGDQDFADSAILTRPWSGNPFPLTDRQWLAVARHSFGRGTSVNGQLPAEAMTGATDLLRRLVGRPLTTASGRLNTVIEVRPPHVIVSTERSPNGQPVPVAWVDDALRRLLRDGCVELHPRTSTYRSAFLGAVLLTLPGARSSGSPPVITLDAPSQLDAATGAFTFDGDLERFGVATHRGEQALLRQRLFASATDADCAICGETYPVRFLRAAHIKKRAVCTEQEARDLDHIAMPACLLGCDALFEAGYIAVDPTGHVIVTGDPGNRAALDQRLAELADRRVDAHTTSSASYFAWHRENTFRS
ncbi:EVE domain-containing protein [Micromonospora sp. SD19]|uniref:EVE domain-containing protein n=1 Tax=Micromonospora parva TaxID=1464048 RepID=UPI00366C22BF